MISISLFFTLFFCILCLFDRRFNNLKYIFLIITVGAIAYHTIPLAADDLTRYNAEMDVLARHDFSWALQYGTWRTNWIATFVLFFFGKISRPELLPVLTSTCLIIAFYFLMRKYTKKVAYAGFAFLLVECVFGAFLDIYLIMNIVRNTLAMLFLVIVLQFDYKGKIKTPLLKLFLYAMLPFIHTAMLPIVMIIFFAKIKLPSMLKYLFMIASPLSINTFTRLFGSSGISFLVDVSDKAENYKGQYAMGESWILTAITLFMVAIVIVVLMSKLRKLSNELGAQASKHHDYKYVELVLCLTISMLSIFFVSQSLLFRLFPLIILLAAPYMYEYISDKSNLTYNKLLIIICLIGCTSLRWIYQYINYFRIWQISI